MQDDARKLQHRTLPEKYVVLIVRKGASRRFTGGTEESLSTAISQMGYKVAKYYGHISQAETISLFAQASGIVGYHSVDRLPG